MPPPAVLLVTAGHAALAVWFAYLSTIAWTASVGRTFPVAFAAFTFHFTSIGARFVACAAVGALVFQAYAVVGVLRRRASPLRLIGGLVLTALLIAVSDLHLIAVQNGSPGSVPFPAPGLWHHLLTQDVLIGISIAIGATIWRHPDLARRRAVWSLGRREHIDGEDHLVRTVASFCGRLGFRRVDEGADEFGRLIVLVGPRVPAAPQALCVLADSLAVSADATALRTTQWVDLRRQDAASFRELARALLPSMPASALIPSPVAPERFVAPRPVTYALGTIVGQSAVALQFALLTLTTPPASTAWHALLPASVMLNASMAIALVRRSWRPWAFRCCTVLAALASAAVEITVLQDTGWSLSATVAVALLLALQLLVYLGCVLVTYTIWMSRAPSAGSLASTVDAVWPSAAAALFLVLVASPILLGLPGGS